MICSHPMGKVRVKKIDGMFTDTYDVTCGSCGEHLPEFEGMAWYYTGKVLKWALLAFIVVLMGGMVSFLWQ